MSAQSDLRAPRGQRRGPLVWAALAVAACGPVDIGELARPALPGLVLVAFQDGPPRDPPERRVFAGERVRVAVRVRNDTAETMTELRVTLLFHRRDDDSPVDRPPRVRPLVMDTSLASGAEVVLPQDVELERMTPEAVWRVGVRVDGVPSASVSLPRERWHTWFVERLPLPGDFPGRPGRGFRP